MVKEKQNKTLFIYSLIFCVLCLLQRKNFWSTRSCAKEKRPTHSRCTSKKNSRQMTIMHQMKTFKSWLLLPTKVYGNTGCGVFEGVIQNYKGFWLKINCSQMKSLNYANWCDGHACVDIQVFPASLHHPFCIIFFFNFFEKFFFRWVFWQKVLKNLAI